jgi:hypothetical protein
MSNLKETANSSTFITVIARNAAENENQPRGIYTTAVKGGYVNGKIESPMRGSIVF